ncbi:DUF6875 domain-containing protein [Streptomyces sp. NPDC016562]|uniref:DUF6875 domain-containing protein n=1 Tax=Streptomyces sp. NPDC016562 TaxID=3364966 RepID=UPI003701B182
MWAWAHAYLCQPHPALGRRGPVCPYVPASIDGGRFHVASYRGPGDARAVHRAIDECLLILLEASTPGQLKTSAPSPLKASTPGPHAAGREVSPVHTTVLLTFPYLPLDDACALVEDVQRAAKTSLARRGLMIGEFHPGPPPAPGLHNPLFRPFDCPAPLLALRHMLAADEPFMRDHPDHRAAYDHHFPSAGDRRRSDRTGVPA